MSSQPSRFVGSARILAVCTLCSRFTGLARDMVMNYVFGQGWVQDAFNYGFIIPNLFRRLFGEGALSAVFVPVFTQVLDQKGRTAAWLLLGRVTGLMALALSVVVLLLEGGALLIGMFAHNVSHLHLGLTAVMAPFMLGVCIVALFSSILNCLHHFTVPGLLPIVLNTMIIIGALVVGPMLGTALDEKVYGVGYCVLVASALQLAIIVPVLRRHGVHFRMSLDLKDPDVRRMLRLFVPVVLGQGVLLFNAFFDTQICTTLTQSPHGPATFSLFGSQIAYPLRGGALSAMNNAARLYQFPLGVLAISLATAAFPMFSLYASRKDFDGLRGAVAQALRLAIFVGAPSGLMLMILGKPIISLLFQHGRFDAADTQRAANILIWYGLGMTAYCCQHILLRGFYSLGDVMTPMKVSCVLVVVNLVTTLSLIWYFKERVFGMSTALTSFLHVCVTVYLLRSRLGGRMGARKIVASAVRTVVATIAAGLCAWFAYHKLATMSLDVAPTLRDAIHVFGPLGLAVVAFFGVGLALRMEEFAWLFKRATQPAEG